MNISLLIIADHKNIFMKYFDVEIGASLNLYVINVKSWF